MYFISAYQYLFTCTCINPLHWNSDYFKFKIYLLECNTVEWCNAYDGGGGVVVVGLFAFSFCFSFVWGGGGLEGVEKEIRLHDIFVFTIQKNESLGFISLKAFL